MDKRFHTKDSIYIRNCNHKRRDVLNLYFKRTDWEIINVLYRLIEIDSEFQILLAIVNQYFKLLSIPCFATYIAGEDETFLVVQSCIREITIVTVRMKGLSQTILSLK